MVGQLENTCIGWKNSFRPKIYTSLFCQKSEILWYKKSWPPLNVGLDRIKFITLDVLNDPLFHINALETKTFGLVVAFEMWRCWIVQIYRGHSVVLSVCWGRRPHILLIWGHSSNLIGPTKGLLRSLNKFYKKLFSNNSLFHAFFDSMLSWKTFATNSLKWNLL